MSQNRPSLPRVSLSPLLALVVLGLSAVSHADMNAINKSFWKMLYGVTDAQAASATWLAADDDADGITNGAEIAAATNPFNPGSSIKVTTLTASSTSVSLTFPTMPGKRYVLQTTAGMSPAAWGILSPSVEVTGDGVPKTLTGPKSAGVFFRVLVQDLDSDGDGVSDWAEQVAGYNPNSAQTNGTTNDSVAITNALLTENMVTIAATSPSALQPPDAVSAPINIGQVTVSRTGSLLFSAITVPLAKAGSATEGTDYAGLPGFVVIPAHANSVSLNVTPMFNAALKTNRTAIVTALAGGGYTISAPTSASVVINPAGNATGTGLTATYTSGSSTTYSSGSNFNTTTASGFTRVDPTIDFTFPTSPAVPANTGGTANNNIAPVGALDTAAPASSTYTVRWKGQIQPQYTGTYYFVATTNDGAKLFINGQVIIDNWVVQGTTDQVGSIDLQAGVLYDIQLDYLRNSGGAEAHLSWYSADQVKQIVPQNRLYPAPTQANKVTAITSSLTAIGYVGTPFGFNVTSPNIGGTTNYALAAGSAPLPPGLSLNTATGAITGTPTAAGYYNVAVNATNTAAAAVTGSSVINFTIFPTGSVSREILATTGSQVASIVIPAGTPAHDAIPTLDEDTDYGNNTGERLRGYIVPPKTGNYYFWIAANNAAELWISNDSESVNRVRRASVTANTGPKTWNTFATQQTAWLALVAGQKYYFEVLHNTGADADDYVTMGWCQDDIGTVPSVAGAPNPNGVTPLIPNGGAALQGYPLSGTVPGYIFQPYDYPPPPSSTGTLYAANLGPQGSATSKASGTANLRVDPSGTSAVLHFSYSGLTTARTGYHLHVDAFDSHPAGEIVFDIDDIDSFHPELKTADGGYIWNFTAGGTFTSVAQVLDGIQRGKVYLNIHTVSFPAGEIRGNLTFVDGSQAPPNPAAYAEPATTDLATNDANAARFLNQATFGASPADVAYVKANGFSGWINDQLAKPANHSSNDVVAGLTSDINTPYPSSLFTNAWWKYSITGSDQLRQRVAFALSEIMVVSYNNNTGPLQNNGRILADYYDQLVDYVLPTAGLADSGTFRGLLKAASLTPAMGLYLDMRGNQKGDDSLGRHPNENYAREIMQLFSVGIYRMWDDGKFVLDSKANLPATYNQSSILGMSALLTGWNYSQPNQSSGRLPTSFSPSSDYLNPMVLVPTYHDLNAKLLLNNVVTPAATGRTPRVSIASVGTGSPCTVTTATVHGLKTGDTIMISGVTGGTFTTGGPINASFLATVTSTTTFTVPVQCTVAAGAAGTVTGATITPANFTPTSGIAAITGSQADSTGVAMPHPYDQYGLTELDTAIDNIVNNDNVPPYICRQLIQRLVTSDPSPGYLYRVVQKFKDNGSGVRGDLAAVIKQILLDGEARSTSAAFSNIAFGKQREPVMRLTGPARAFPAVNYTGTYTQLSGIDSNKFRLVTSTPNDFSQSFTVSLDFRGNYSPPGQTTSPSTNPTTTTYAVGLTLGIASASTAITDVALGSPSVITTAQPHGLATGNAVSITGVTGGTYLHPTTSAVISINATYAVTVIGPTSFSIPVNCTVLPTSLASAKFVSNPCKITTTQGHGLTTGDSVTISGVTGGTFSPTINGTFAVTVVDPTSFTVPSNCTVAPTSVSIAQIVGANTLDVTATGMVNVSYSQVAASSTMTVNTTGPATNVAIPVPNSATTTLKSRVYLHFLTQTTAGGEPIPADGVYDVEANGSGNFTVTTADTPATARSGNVIIPKITSSYTPQTSNTIVQFNTNVNHNLLAGQNVWVDAPVATSPLTDGEYTITTVTDEDHFKTSYLPVSSGLGTYPKPSGSNNGATLWPLVPAPMGRSGVVTINQSTFSLGSTESTLTQSPLNAPTVFNYFFPNYRYPGTLSNLGIDSPEFQLTTDTNVQNLTNSLTNMFISSSGGNGNLNGLSSFNNGGGSVVMSIEPYMTDAKTAESGIPGLVDELASLLVGAPLEANTKTTIVNFVNHKNGSNVLDYLPYTTPTNQQKRDRVRAVIHLIITSAEYAAQK